MPLVRIYESRAFFCLFVGEGFIPPVDVSAAANLHGGVKTPPYNTLSEDL